MMAHPVRSDHTFHIPVMGTGFTLDTPLRVARFGISSVVSLVDDVLIEQARRHHCMENGEPYEPIGNDHPDPRAARITAYFDLLDRLVRRQSEALRASPIEPGGEIYRYYELLPETPLKRRFRSYLHMKDPSEKRDLELQLRESAVSGAIDANIMTKLDPNAIRDGVEQPAEFGDAMAALRGFARSSVNAAIVFSAGINHRLYAYLSEFPDFMPQEDGTLRKRVTLKVSDFRSAQIQGRFLAKSGVWVSEFRIESGINCGGHTFPTAGLLMGPILEEFKQKRAELVETLFAAVNRTRAARKLPPLTEPPEVRVTVQGGIGNASEDELMLKYYEVDGTGWGTPFLLAPDAVNVDEEHLRKLMDAGPEDVRLSDSSPMGVPFWNLMTSASEEARRQRIAEGHPGSPCPKGYLRFESRFGKPPICSASRQFQRQALAAPPPPGEAPSLTELKHEILQHKSCICHDLGGGFLRRHGIAPRATPAICCGPNILYFKRITTLDELIGHIYGRVSDLCATERPHMLIQELRLYIAYLKDQIEGCSKGLLDRTPKYFEEFVQNLSDGIRYYRERSCQIVSEQRDRFLDELGLAQRQLETVMTSPSGVFPGRTG